MTPPPATDSAVIPRPLVLADYDAVMALWRETEGMGLGENDTPDGIARFLARNPDLSLACEADGRLVGAVLCGHDGRRGYLHHLAVHRAYRGRGYGRALVDEALRRLHALGITRCNIFLYADHAPGRAFWTHARWRGRPDLVLMQKPTAPDAVPCPGVSC